MTGQVNPLWTDEELDRGLARLRSEAVAARGGDAAVAALPVARARLIAAADRLAAAPAAGGTDVAAPATGDTDAGVPAAGGMDAGVPAVGGMDAGVPAVGGMDAGVPATGDTDAGVPEAGGTDGGNGNGSVPARVPRWRRGRWIAAAGAVAAGLVAAGVLIVAPFTGGSKPAAAAPVLSRAADAVTTRPDDPVEPGQYRYVQTTLRSVSRVTAAGHPNLAWRTTSRTRLWVPYDETGTWTRTYRTVSGPRWLQGTAREAKSNPLYGQVGEPAPTARARCGDFAAAAPAPTGRYCPGAGDWKQPTPHWLDTLPRDPHRLLAVLTADTGGEPGAERAGDALQRAWLLLGSGLAPADLRAALYRALALLPELRVTERVANLDGRRGTALGVDDGRLRRDLVIDPRTGRYLGQRLVLSAPDAGSDHGEPLPAGTVLDQTSVTVGVADHAGTVPTD